jgi:hypothetical protein
MRHRMTAADLAALYDAEPTATVRALLWEVARLRSVIKRAHQIRVAVGDTAPTNVNSITWTAFCSEVDREPCVTDKPTERQTRRTERGVQTMKARDRT